MIDNDFESQWGQNKAYEICIFCLKPKYAALGGYSQEWWARNHDNISDWNDMAIRRLLFQLSGTVQIEII